jgi:hypothetical protein
MGPGWEVDFWVLFLYFDLKDIIINIRKEG